MSKDGAIETRKTRPEQRNVRRIHLPMICMCHTRLSAQHPESPSTPIGLPHKMVFCTLPDGFEHVRFGKEELDVVVCPRSSREALQKHDDFLRSARDTGTNATDGGRADSPGSPCLVVDQSTSQAGRSRRRGGIGRTSRLLPSGSQRRPVAQGIEI